MHGKRKKEQKERKAKVCVINGQLGLRMGGACKLLGPKDVAHFSPILWAINCWFRRQVLTIVITDRY